MPKITIEELKKKRDEARKAVYLREGNFTARVIVHMGTCGIAAGARNIVSAFLNAIEKSGRRDIMLTTTGCAGLCSKEPMATIEVLNQPPVKYVELTPEKVERIFKEHLLENRIVYDFALGLGSERGG